MKFIIYGIGQILKSNLHRIDMNNVLGFVDGSFDEHDKRFMDKKVIMPNEIKTYDFDYIVVFTDKYFNEIAENLIWNYSIHVNKIISYINVFEIQSFRYREKVSRAIVKYINHYNMKNVLDVGAFIGHTEFCSKNYSIMFDCLIGKENQDLQFFYYNLYREIYKDIKLLKDNYYDLIFLFETELSLYTEYIKRLKSFGDMIFFPIRMGDEKKYIKIFGEYFNLLNIDGILFGVLCEVKELKIYEITHKLFSAPDDDLYVPIYAGSYKGGLDSYIHDDTGDNISQYNDKINEATAMYWMWKNDDSEYVGINHYRRFFQSEINSFCYLQKIELFNLLHHYDIIVAKPAYSGKFSVKEDLCHSIYGEAFDCAMKHLQQLFEKGSISDKQAFEFVFDGNMIFPCNMMMMKKNIYDEYCSWLFPKVLELIGQVEIKAEWDNYSKRIIGFITERLFTVWMVQQKYCVCEVPIKFLGEFSEYGKS